MKTVILIAAAMVVSCAAHAKNSNTKWPLEPVVLDNILVSQLDCGGWGKNCDKSKPFSTDKRERFLDKKSDAESATIDNNASTTEIRWLFAYYEKTHDRSALDAAMKGLEWLLSSQMENGGWPQFPARKKGYWMQITFNDNAMRNVLALVRDASLGEPPFASLDTPMRKRCEKAFEKGLSCVLKCQIRVNGKPTVWCQQHDRVTLKPTGARAYELPSYCSQESAEMVLFLMSLPNPSKEVKDAIKGAVEWFEKNRLEDGRWARFYDLEECKPFFCDRSGEPKRKLEEIDPNRQKGYSWYNKKGEQVLKKAKNMK